MDIRHLDPINGDTLYVQGDIHGATKGLLAFIKANPEATVLQLGDFGFADTYATTKNVSKDNLLIVGGNHDEYPVLETLENYLGDFGTFNIYSDTYDLKAMYVRGAYSVDRQQRTLGFDWWPNEELSYQEFQAFLDLAETYKPDVLFSHSHSNKGLFKVMKIVYNLSSSLTSLGLMELFKMSYAPKLHIHGHLHHRISYVVDNTTCVSLGTDTIVPFNELYEEIA